MTRSESEGPASAESDGRFAQSAQQASMFHNGRIGTRVQYHDTRPDPLSLAAPANFVPAGWLTAIMCKLSPQPMILQTESIPTPECIPIMLPLKLIVMPVPTTKLADDGRTPLRCITVEASGTGELSRYYLRPDGSIDSIDFPNDLQQIRSDEATVKFEFGSEPRMVP